MIPGISSRLKRTLSRCYSIQVPLQKSLATCNTQVQSGARRCFFFSFFYEGIKILQVKMFVHDYVQDPNQESCLQLEFSML